MLLTLPSFLFRQVVWLRGQLYDHGLLTSRRVDCPVISVGNLTVGGTGKTPFSIWLLNRIQSQHLKPAFVSRGYKSNGSQSRAVTHVAAQEFGDEPSLVRELYPDIPVYVGADRTRTIEKMLNDASADIIVADDAFQHRRLKRDLDIVLLDALEPEWHYRFLPAGRARESFQSLARANVVVISKANLSDEKKLRFLEDKLMHFNGLKLKMNYKCGGYRNQHHRRQSLAGGIFLVSGVGRPDSVEALLPSKPMKHNTFPDHHAYSVADVQKLLQDFRSSGAENFVTTAKDAVKLNQFSELKGVIWEMDLTVELEGNLEELDRQILGLVRSRTSRIVENSV